MKRSRYLRISGAAAVLLIGLLASPKDSAASGYLTARFGTDHGTPAMANGFAVYFNPGALGGTTGTTITGDLSVLARFARYTRTSDALSPSDESYRNDPGYVNANRGTANLSNVLALPYVGINTDFGTKNLRAGWAAYIPFGGLASWDRREGVAGSPGSVDGVSRWHNISGQIISIYNTFAVAYKVTPSFSVGASISPVFHTVSTVRARNADGSDDTLTPAGDLVEGRSLLEAHGINFAASAGVYWEPTETLHLGLSYNSQPGFGTSRLSGTLRTQLGSGQESKSDIDFLQTLPDIIRFGGQYQVNRRLDVKADFEFVRWSVFDKQCVVEKGADCAVADDGRRLPGAEGQRVQLNVPRNWNNAIGVRAGPGYMLTEDLEGFGSVGFTTPAVPKSTIDASTIDSQRLYFTLGAKYRFSKHFALAGSYNHIYFVPVNTDGANNQNLRANPAKSPGGGDYNVSRSPSADGRYRSQIGFLNVNVAYTF